MADLIKHHERHDPPMGMIPVPHGPETGQEHEHYPSASRTNERERQIFSYLTHPDDSYTPEGVYWADLPLAKRMAFVNKVHGEETASEFKSFLSMVKKDPLSPVSWYFRNAVLPGAGLGLEGYVLFSIGNLEPLFAATWPECWGKGATVCSANWIASVTYLEVIGIMVGQIGVGFIGDWIGRRWGLIQDAVIMFVGLLMLTASWGLSLQGWVICYAWSLFFYGFGVGGEYPITATSSMENAVSSGKLSTREDRLHRGRKVTMAFLMQGWGQLINQGLLMILLLCFHHGSGSPPYSAVAVQWTFRVSFALPAIGTLWLVYYRTYKMPHASRQLDVTKRKNNVTGYDVASLKIACRHFGGRLLATAGTWFCNDVFFYGNKLFQGQFIRVIAPDDSSVMTTWTWNMVNVVVSMCGYYCASLLIDHKLYGRKMMQQVGFLMCFIMFVVPAFHYNYYTEPMNIRSFQAMYFLSSFFNQFGPNSVTFLVAGEVFPTPIRATAHGISACIGKAGALLASVLYNYIDTQTKFYVIPWFGLAGMVLTFFFLPDTTGLDLKEQERRWAFIRAGEEEKYHGVAIHPTHLSWWERFRGVHKPYDQELDLQDKIMEVRREWEMKEREKKDMEVKGTSAPLTDIDDEMFTDHVHDYFKETSPKEGKDKEKEKEVESDGRSTEGGYPGDEKRPGPGGADESMSGGAESNNGVAESSSSATKA